LFFHFFGGPSLIFPVRAARNSQGEIGTILIMSSHLLTFGSSVFAKNAVGLSRRMSGEVLHENQVQSC